MIQNIKNIYVFAMCMSFCVLLNDFTCRCVIHAAANLTVRFPLHYLHFKLRDESSMAASESICA